jgi:hypothetical protein
MYQGVNSPRWSRPIPKRVASISSLEEFSLDENALIPDLSSDSESISSSIDDIPTLVQNFGNGALHSSGGVPLADKYISRHMWETDHTGTTSNLRIFRLVMSLPFVAPENGLAQDAQQPHALPRPTGNGNAPPGLTVASVEQALGDMEISGDVQLQRRREVRILCCAQPVAYSQFIA